jgi:hypothetical protein
MEREQRYVVFKIKDMFKYLSEDEIEVVGDLLEKVVYGRQMDSREPLKCVTVESDWPEYEMVWDMIEKRVDGNVRDE